MKKSGFVFLFALVACVMAFSSQCFAEGFNAMRLTERVAVGAGTVVYTYTGNDDDSAGRMPDGYLFAMNSGNKFYVRRNTTGAAVFETNVFTVPEASPIVMTPLQAVRVGVAYVHTFELSGTAVGDTISVTPLDK